jgi:hypothetical protein
MSVVNYDPEFIDVDFEKQPNYVGGAIDPSDYTFGDNSDYSKQYGEMSPKEIDKAIRTISEKDSGLHWLVPSILDQKQEGACTADAIIGAHHTKQAEQHGLGSVMLLSAISLYQRIARSAQSGSSPSDGMKELENRGAIPLDTPENRKRFGNIVMPNTGFSHRPPADWEPVAKKFCSMEWHVVKSIEGLMTALINRDPVVVGRQGHAIYYTTPIIHKGEWGAVYPNSWGKWGMSMGAHTYGFGIDTLKQIKLSAKWAYVLRSVNTPHQQAA